MLEHLFGSKTRIKLLRLFFKHPEKVFFVRELTRILDVQINAIRRELELLTKSGLVLEAEKKEPKSEIGKPGLNLRKYYALNKESILYPEMNALILKSQVLGEQKFVQELQQKAGDIKLLLLTGQFTGDKRAPSDILVVGDLREQQIEKLMPLYEKEFGFPIRYTTMTQGEFMERRYVMDKFIFSLFEGEKVLVINKLGI